MIEFGEKVHSLHNLKAKANDEKMEVRWVKASSWVSGGGLVTP